MWYIFRQLALKALNERLSKAEQPASWPSMEEDQEAASPQPAAVPTPPQVLFQHNCNINFNKKKKLQYQFK